MMILIGLLSYFTRPRAGLEPLNPSQNQPRTVKVASKNFTEQLFLSELMIPIPGWGLYASATYMFYTLGGGLSPEGYLEDAGFDPENLGVSSEDLSEDFQADTSLHLLSFGLGYRFWLLSRVSLSFEVAYLFAGIFMTIVPALAILRAGEKGPLAFLIEAVREPSHYFWVTGILSSFLDNAPTYLTFFNTALGQLGSAESEVPGMLGYLAESVRNPGFIQTLLAISAGAVFMGANTYIGNAPNFMVKSIAEEAGVPMPSFFGYLFRWSVPILLPLFVLVTWVFF